MKLVGGGSGSPAKRTFGAFLPHAVIIHKYCRAYAALSAYTDFQRGVPNVVDRFLILRFWLFLAG